MFTGTFKHAASLLWAQFLFDSSIFNETCVTAGPFQSNRINFEAVVANGFNGNSIFSSPSNSMVIHESCGLLIRTVRFHAKDISISARRGSVYAPHFPGVAKELIKFNYTICRISERRGRCV